jgi:hypothetical protein
VKSNDTSTSNNKPLESDPFSFDDDSAFDFDAPQSVDKSALEASEVSQSTFQIKEDPFSFEEDSEFNFDQPQAGNILESEEKAPFLLEPLKFIECICPKCTGKNEIEFALISVDGLETVCTACNKKINIIRESCACRAKRKSNEINCTNCGRQLDHHTHCHSCGKIFPDYFVTVNPEDARRKARNEFYNSKWASLKELKFSFRSSSARSTQDFAYDYATSRTSDETGISKLISRKALKLVAGFVVVVALIATGVYAFNSYKSGRQYAENYFKTLYCIKTGLEANLKACESTKAEWEAALQTGRSYVPTMSSRDEIKSSRLHGDIDKLMQTMSNPPAKFAQANEKLLEIHKIYLDSESFMQTPPKTILDLSNKTNNLSKKMSKASQELKAGMPEALKPELEIAKLKYRGMKDF